MTNVSKFLSMYVVFQKNETNPQSFFVSVFGILFVFVPAQIPVRWTWLVFSMKAICYSSYKIGWKVEESQQRTVISYIRQWLKDLANEVTRCGRWGRLGLAEPSLHFKMLMVCNTWWRRLHNFFGHFFLLCKRGWKRAAFLVSQNRCYVEESVGESVGESVEESVGESVRGMGLSFIWNVIRKREERLRENSSAGIVFQYVDGIKANMQWREIPQHRDIIAGPWILLQYSLCLWTALA